VAASGDERLEELAQALPPLELAKPGGVGGAHVDHEVVGVRAEPGERREVVIGGALERGVARLPEVHAEREPMRQAAPLPVGASQRGALGRVVVEAEAVDGRTVGREAPYARPRVPRLGMPGDRADLAEAEAERGPRRYGPGPLVEAGGE